MGEHMEETISLRELFETLKKRMVLIVVLAFGAVIASGAISYFVLTPQYQATTQILVSQQATGASFLTATFGDDSQYIETYNVILKSPYILEQVIEQLELERSHYSLNSQLAVSQEGRSQVVTIRVTDTDPAMAVEIANITAAVFQQEVLNLMRVDNVHILSPAELGENPSPVSPNPTLNMAIALVVGLMAGVGIAFLLEYLDNSIRTEQDIEKHLGLPVLGAIPIIEQSDYDDEAYTTNRSVEKKMGSGSIGS